MSARPTTSPGRLPARARAAFTLVELLMVLLIIGLLMGLLFPAINSARESGRRTQCINNMTEIGKAIESFEATSTRYPGWVEYPFGVRYLDPSTNPVLAPPFQEITPPMAVTRPGEYLAPTNYFVPLLPALGREDIFSPGNAVRAWKTPEFVGGNPPTAIRVVAPTLHNVAVCPSDATRMGSDEAELSYVVNSGRHDDLNSVSFPFDWKANGVFMNLIQPQPGTTQSVNASYIRGNDGMDTTLLLSEKTKEKNPNGYWFNIGDEDGTAFHYELDGSGANEQPIPGEGLNTTDEYPSSNHPGGVVVVFAGQNARFITNEVDFRVWVALHTPNGAHSKIPGTDTPSNFARMQPKLTEADLDP